MTPRSILIPAVTAIVLAACESAPTAPAGLTSDSPAFAQGKGPVVASVTGHYQSDLGGPSKGPDAVHHKFSFGALQYADGTVGGNFQVTLHNVEPARRNVTFEVVCLHVEGNQAWVGGVIKAPKTDPFVGGYDIWRVVDGGQNGPDQVQGFIGVYAPSQELRESLCQVAPVAPGDVPAFITTGVFASEGGEIHVRGEE